MNNPLAGDLDHILTQTEGLWEDLRGKRLFITGGTGFFGCWFLESFAWANDKLDLNAAALVLTRNHGAFQKKAPHLAANPAIKFHVGDVRDFSFPEGEFTHIIHAAATSAIATFHNEDPLVKFETVVQGTRRVLEHAVRCGAQKLLLTSSGVVYGKQPPHMTRVSEEYYGTRRVLEQAIQGGGQKLLLTRSGAAEGEEPPPLPHILKGGYGSAGPIDHHTVWGECKREAEFLCAYSSLKYGIATKIARCFTFVGPYLPLDIHYAIGNFIRDALNGGPIQVKGDGTPCRSYLYAADLMIWLWTILFRGEPRCPYNVGSEEEITISELAHTVVRRLEKPVEVRIAKSPDSNRPPERYVPCTRRAQVNLGLRQYVDLETAIERTLRWNRACRSSGEIR